MRYEEEERLRALTQAAMEAADGLETAEGWRQAVADDPHLAAGVNVHDGRVTCEAVAKDLALDYAPLSRVD